MFDLWLVRRILGGSYVESHTGKWYRIVTVGPREEERVQTDLGLMPVDMNCFVQRQDF